MARLSDLLNTGALPARKFKKPMQKFQEGGETTEETTPKNLEEKVANEVTKIARTILVDI